MKTILLRLAGVALIAGFGISANAATIVGTFLDDAAWTLIHAGAGPEDALNNPAEFLRWDPGQTVTMDLTGDLLTAGGGQMFSLTSDSGHTATFTLNSFTADLSGPDGFNGGDMTYNLVVDSGPLIGSILGGTFLFDAVVMAGTPFNTSTLNGSDLELYLWGGDTANGIGIDIGVSAVVPIPAPLLLLASSIFGLGLMRRK